MRVAPSGPRLRVYPVENVGKTAKLMAWLDLVSKESSYGGMGVPNRAWLGTRSGNSNSDCGDVSPENEGKKDGENVKNVQRRQRAAAVAGNLDLLTIPGVGPRNLQKLVEKGFEGVAQLKQLYKDKVWRIPPHRFVCVYIYIYDDYRSMFLFSG